MIKKGDLQQKIAEGENVRITDINGLSLIIKGTKKGTTYSYVHRTTLDGKRIDRTILKKPGKLPLTVTPRQNPDCIPKEYPNATLLYHMRSAIIKPSRSRKRLLRLPKRSLI